MINRLKLNAQKYNYLFHTIKRQIVHNNVMEMDFVVIQNVYVIKDLIAQQIVSQKQVTIVIILNLQHIINITLKNNNSNMNKIKN